MARMKSNGRRDCDSISETGPSRSWSRERPESSRGKTPLVLTVNGRAELVVQDAGSYQEMLDRLEHAETMAALRRGLKDAEAGRMIPLDEAVKKLRAKHGF